MIGMLPQTQLAVAYPQAELRRLAGEHRLSGRRRLGELRGRRRAARFIRRDRGRRGQQQAEAGR